MSMKRVKISVGDVFSVPIGVNAKKYFQYIASDFSQLNADVIRAFARVYPLSETPDMDAVVSDEVCFHAHVVIRWGLKMDLWSKAGHAGIHGAVNVLFRDTNDYGTIPGKEPIRVSHNWYVWRIGEPFRHVGSLEGENRSAEIGIVASPENIVERMRSGRYLFTYPGFE
jgi:hypothetical protein